MIKYSNLLLKVSAVFGLIGAVLGAHMAGSGGYAYRPIHAHSLVVGWLTLFSWAVYYRVFHKKDGVLVKLHVYSAIAGSIGLTGGWQSISLNLIFCQAQSILLFILAGESFYY